MVRSTMWNRGHSYEERLDRDAAGRTVLAYLSERYHHSTESAWRDRIASGRVLLDGVPANETSLLRRGQRLVWRRPPWREPDGPSSFAVLYRDDDVFAVAKPRGLPTMPGGGYLERTLLALVRRRVPDASPLHRLGRGTSGIVLFTTSPEARRALTAAWSRGEVLRSYRALVRGRAGWNEHVVNAPIGPVPHPLLGSVFAARTDGKRAVSRLRRLEARASTTLVEVAIETGRTHQIRIHLARAGHPLVGDRLYPAGGVPGPDVETLPGETGYWLHAHRLELVHPRGGRRVEVACAPPPPLRLGARCS